MHKILSKLTRPPTIFGAVGSFVQCKYTIRAFVAPTLGNANKQPSLQPPKNNKGSKSKNHSGTGQQQTPPNPPVKGFLETVTNLNPYQKLYFALGWFVFSLLGVWATYKLEELMPTPKRQAVSPEIAAKSRIDLLLLEETEQELEAMAATEK
ncbi:hypothetical protein HK100_009231 [Physocladia obscura]|uniref:Uncharacterized protein n=1 Tax=Physocladia obscura TaxID=109957 RepID=A0AAD5T9W9_9FUNG|nr:hypothetical protein HK100_009231 [Physocladia obscura]